MDTIRQYVLSVICIVICCGVLQLAVPKGTVGTLFRVISGLAVTITVLSPLLNGKMLYWNYQFDRIVSDSTIAISEGQNIASDLLKQRIKEETESYILTKASDLNVEMDVDVNLASDYPNTPVAVTMKGKISPYAKQRLATYIANDLAIPGENQIWISEV